MTSIVPKADWNWSFTLNGAGKVGIPKQIVIKKDASSIPGAVAKAGLMLPIGAFFLLHSIS